MPQSTRPPLRLPIQRSTAGGERLRPSLLTARAEENQITEFNPPTRCACDPHLKAGPGETIFTLASSVEEKVAPPGAAASCSRSRLILSSLLLPSETSRVTLVLTSSPSPICSALRLYQPEVAGEEIYSKWAIISLLLFVSLAGGGMDVEDEVLLFQPNWAEEEGEEEEAEEEDEDVRARRSCLSGEGEASGPWRAVGWVYTRPAASGVVLGAAVLVPCALFAHMLLYCPPLDIDLSYSAFEVHSHFSAERFDALAIAVKSQLGSWDRRRRDLDLQELLVGELSRRRAQSGSVSQRHLTAPEDDQRRASLDGLAGLAQGEAELQASQGNSSLPAARNRRSVPDYYMQSQALWRIELVFVAQGDGSNIFTPERLQTIHHVERLLMQQPHFQQFCWKPLEMLRDLPLGPSYCSPPSSLLSYLYPSERGGKIYYDGMGPDLADIQGERAEVATVFTFSTRVKL